jgi:NitT/TauT family transport system permease protein
MTVRNAVATALPPTLLLIALIGAWQALVSVGNIPPFILPGPAAIADQFSQFREPITGAALVTGRNALVGLIVGALLGIITAIISVTSWVVDKISEPIISALAVVPIVALAPVLYSMFGAGSEQARIIVAGLAVYVPVYLNTLTGLRQVLPVHKDLMRALAAPSRDIIRFVTIPTATPYVFTGLRMASALAVISAIVAEYFGGPRSGVGSFITTAAAGSNYAQAWAYVFGGIVVGLIFYTTTLALETYALRKAGRR